MREGRRGSERRASEGELAKGSERERGGARGSEKERGEENKREGEKEMPITMTKITITLSPSHQGFCPHSMSLNFILCFHPSSFT